MPLPKYLLDQCLSLSTDAALAFRSCRFTAKQVVEGVISGMHKSPHKGFSVEFSEHREYVAGG